MTQIEIKEKAQELIDKFRQYSNAYKWTSIIANRQIVIVDTDEQLRNAKRCAVISIQNEYHEKRELLILLRANRVIENSTTYLSHLDRLIEEEKQVKQEIQAL